MQTAHRTSHIKRIREISFSSLENYNSKNESRNGSPSIALESILKDTPSDKEPEDCLYTIRKRYVQNDEYIQESNKRQKYDERKENIGSIGLNILKSKTGHCNMQTKQQNLIQHISKISKTPLKDKANAIQNQYINTSAYYSNMSPVEDEKNEAASLKTKDKRSISSLNYADQDHSYEVISSTSYEMLSEKYLNSTKRNQSQHSSECNIEGEISKLRKQIEKLQCIKNNRIIQIDHKIVSQSCATDRKPQHQKTTDRMNVKSNYTQKQGETLSLSGSNSTDCLIRSRIVTFKQGINSEDVKRPKLLSKMFSKVNKCAKEKSSIKQSFVNSQAISTKKVSLATSKPQKITIPSPKYTQQLLQCLQKQINLDQNFRKAKKWFKKYTSPRKWQDLRACLLSQDISLSQEEHKNIFSLTIQQQSPFYTPKQSDYTIGQLVLNYIAAQNHWSNFVHKKHSAKLLQQGSFKESNLDISKRGQICIEDLVRYINFELDTCYRNRDIYLIFNRFSRGEKLYFTGILQCLSNEAL